MPDWFVIFEIYHSPTEASEHQGSSILMRLSHHDSQVFLFIQVLCQISALGASAGVKL